ncbi:Nnf1-domain-containing protein [Polychaeton citri CBS 116435]|uniref:Nnf1-domain-containing protein n=1 Tax=Polychaeton citri CBS 116435 TaxID=1314669 RepID=A0A9P4Q9S6_9PEZI|nr:Nnf1-domain-containing protein [Polychaeton citri CBS 116435]
MANAGGVQEGSRSPSPMSAPPLPLTPGPRASTLHKLYSDAVAHILKTCSHQNFASCFPTPAQQVPQAILSLHEQFTERLGKSMRDEFENILEEREVVPSLNHLDRLVEEARKRKQEGSEEEGKSPVAPHTLPAQTLYTAHLQPSLAEHLRDLRSKQETLAHDNTQVVERVLQQRRQIASLLQGLEAVVADVGASVAKLDPAELDTLREETREIDEGMRVDG